MKQVYYIYVVIALLCVSAITVKAQKNQYCGQFHFVPREVVKEGDSVRTGFDIEPGEFRFKRQQMVTFTPVLKSRDGNHSYRFDPVVIAGRTRTKAVKRGIKLGNFNYDVEPAATVRYTGRNNPTIPVDLTAPYETWMRDASMEIEELASGCARCHIAENTYPLVDSVLPPVYKPQYAMAYVTPPVEEVKRRSESYAARLNFKVAKYNLLPGFMDNAAKLKEVDDIVNTVKNDSNLTLTQFSVTGYASPEGNFNSNMKLSENRAKVFVNYVVNKHGLKRNMIDVSWKGEDWNGLKQEVALSDIDYRDQVISIIDSETDIARRKSKLHALNGGRTYRYLLAEVYPPLRRNEYTISYIARPFNPQEAAQLVRTNPQHLSLNEMFHAANTYPKGSTEFKEVFDIAVRMFPDDPIANLNAAALEIEQGAYESGIERSLKVADRPEALNNVGMAYLYMKDYAKAAEYFKKAADAGLSTGADNLRELNKWMENPE